MPELEPSPREWIEQTLREALTPQSFQVQDESHLHRGHAGAAAGGGHFRVRVIAESFRNQTRLQRHRSVYAALAPHMGGAIHALALETLTPDEV